MLERGPDVGAFRTGLLRACAVALGAAICISSATEVAGAPADRRPAPAVLAVLEAGLNVLHDDFRLAPGQAKLPRGLPPVTPISLPASGSFSEQIEDARAGALGNLQAGVLYYLKGTRLFLYVPETSTVTNVFADAIHGTGVASGAAGLEHGTNPDLWLVVVLHSQPDASAWEWLTGATWIDVISTSYNNLYARPVPIVSCPEAEFIPRIVEQGRLVFSAVGNGEQLGEIMSPSGFPQAYQVGGVDEKGRTWMPAHSTTHRSTPNRPYETGDRYEFMAADASSLDGEMVFGGTSGAAPSTAGRATDLVQLARSVLSSTSIGTNEGALARGPSRPQLKRGPLSDGDLTNEELVDVLHHVAQPAEAASPVRYLIEGYGALNEEAMALAERVLLGQVELPDRPEEDAWHARVEQLRAALFPSARCGNP
ncbi:MAG: S8/S53 family peptidase [Actinomycetota bacterium]